MLTQVSHVVNSLIALASKTGNNRLSLWSSTGALGLLEARRTDMVEDLERMECFLGHEKSRELEPKAL